MPFIRMIMMTPISLLAIIFGSAMGLSGIPQTHKIFRRRSAKDISPITYSILAVGSVVWILYGLEVSNLIIVIPNIFGFLVNLSILAGWFLYGR